MGASQITELEDIDGVLHSIQAKLEEICSKYYSNLYAAQPHTTAQIGAKSQAFSCIGDRLSDDIKANLKAPIEMHEIKEALKGIAVGKALGPDGVIIEFYKEIWSWQTH